MVMTSCELAGKTILLFYPTFFGYDNKIAHKMEDYGMKVLLFNSRSVNSVIGRAVFKLFPELISALSVHYFLYILSCTNKIKIDYVLVVERLPKWFLKKLRIQQKDAKYILYMDDSLKNLKGIQSRFKYFDKVLSFDKADTESNHNLIFQPLFFTDEAANSVQNKKHTNYRYDLTFIGTCHSDRYRVVNELFKKCSQAGLKSYTYLYLQSRLVYAVYKIINPSFRIAKSNHFYYKKIGYKDALNIEKESRVVFDIQHPNQSGLTMRTFELLAMNKKMITTNSNIAQYDFFNPSNIYILDRSNIKVDENFFYTDYLLIPESIKSKYSLGQWIIDVLEG